MQPKDLDSYVFTDVSDVVLRSKQAIWGQMRICVFLSRSFNRWKSLLQEKFWHLYINTARGARMQISRTPCIKYGTKLSLSRAERPEWLHSLKQRTSGALAAAASDCKVLVTPVLMYEWHWRTNPRAEAAPYPNTLPLPNPYGIQTGLARGCAVESSRISRHWISWWRRAAKSFHDVQLLRCWSFW